VKVRVMMRLLRDDGWSLVGQRGAHRCFEHPFRPGKVTIAGHHSDDLHAKTADAVLGEIR
jgi:predicted RNA binding protein YcfA (HicA-like mRNA interferase family)